jgi:putative ABC transport system permease protein
MIARLRHLLARLRAVGRSADLDREFAQELASHLEMLTEDNVRRGMNPADARRQAALTLGAASSLQVQHRDVRGFRPLEDLIQDVRFAARLLIKERWFTAAAVAAIALGIGANTVGFTIVNAAFLRGFGFERAGELHVVSWRPERGRRARLSVADYEDWRSQVRSFSDLAAYSFAAVNISDDHAPPEQTQGAWVTANHFDVLRQRTLLGSSFAQGEDRRGADPVVIIGHHIWTNRFARDPEVIGGILRVNGQPATIVGVMPERMKFPENSELWMPFVPTDAQLARDARVLGVFGRLAPGVTRREAETEIDGVARRVIAANPDDTKGLVGGQVETFTGRFLGGAARPMFFTVMGAVVFVLLIACANVANLLLSRAAFRAREVAVRHALGATRWRVVRQLLIESLLLSSLGGAVGLVLATGGVRLFDAAVQQSQPPYWLIFTIDYRVLAYVAGICGATGVLFGLAPALHVSRENQQATLKEGARGSAGSRRAGRFGAGLVVAELALTIVLLCGAGLMLRSFIGLYAIDPGFDTDGLTRMRMQLPPSKYPTDEARRRFFEQLTARLDALPGVQRAALATSVPPLDDEERRFEVDGRQHVDAERRPWVATVTVTAPYFDVLGVGMIRGRAFVEADGVAGAESVVISQVMADREFAGEDPIGRRIRFLPRDDERDAPPQPWRTIVGVSAPFLQGSSDEAFRSAVVYLPLPQRPPRTASIVIRSALPPASVMRSVQEVVQSIDPDQPVFTIQTVAESFGEERIIYRIFATLFAVLAAIGLTLSAVGVYGVMAYAVTQRTQEIGVRMAIGAQRWQVSWLFMRRALVQLTLGLAIGLPIALALARVVRFRLVAIEPNDPVTLITITAVVMAVALPACVVPVLRAVKIDPVVALRTE